ncbi:siderophore-interacting protein [Chelatococcus reniformis]|nr:siderophore-interacting protein [Chelatococcus reniformis]
MTDPSDQPWTRRFRGHRVLQVVGACNVTPLMRRVTLGGPEVVGIPDGSIIKLIIPPAGVRDDCWPLRGPRGEAIWPPEERRPAIRTYTVQHLDRARGELDVDFVRHGRHGVASSWAERAQPGDPIGIGGPFPLGIGAADWYLFAGDHTALPAITRALEELPADARGHAFIEVPDRAEEQGLAAPPGVEVTWLHLDGTVPGASRALIDAARSVAWPKSGAPFVWVGAESRTARAIKAYVRDERGLDRRRFLIIGYWKSGMSEGEYADAHDHDRGEDYHAVADERNGHDHAHEAAEHGQPDR